MYKTLRLVPEILKSALQSAIEIVGTGATIILLTLSIVQQLVTELSDYQRGGETL